jgi:subfamily B ATP-binding cassette protein HlyB/CyaB
MLSTARARGFEAWQQTCPWEELVAVPFPALAELKDGRFLVLGAFAYDRVLLQEPRRGAHASMLTREQFVALWSGRLVLLTTAGTVL